MTDLTAGGALAGATASPLTIVAFAPGVVVGAGGVVVGVVDVDDVSPGAPTPPESAYAGPAARSAADAAPQAASAAFDPIPGNRNSCLLRVPAGLAVGLALKEQRPHRGAFAPGTWFPRPPAARGAGS